MQACHSILSIVVADTGCKAHRSGEEQLLALFEDHTEGDKAKVMHFVETLLSAYESRH